MTHEGPFSFFMVHKKTLKVCFVLCGQKYEPVSAICMIIIVQAILCRILKAKHNFSSPIVLIRATINKRKVGLL